jgi:hypothetical protein
MHYADFYTRGAFSIDSPTPTSTPKKNTFYNHKDLFIRIARNHLPKVVDVTKVSPYVKLAEFLQNFEFSDLHTRKDFKLEIHNTVNITRFEIFNLIRRNISVCDKTLI